LIFVGRGIGLFVAIGATVGDSIVGVPFYMKSPSNLINKYD